MAYYHAVMASGAVECSLASRDVWVVMVLRTDKRVSFVEATPRKKAKEFRKGELYQVVIRCSDDTAALVTKLKKECGVSGWKC